MRAQELTRIAALAALLVGWVPGARAEPYLMVRTGAKCSACHVNQTGGGKRTPFAYIHAHDIERDLDLLSFAGALTMEEGETGREGAEESRPVVIHGEGLPAGRAIASSADRSAWLAATPPPTARRGWSRRGRTSRSISGR